MPQSSPLDFEYKLIINSSIKTIVRLVFTIFECIQQNVLNMSSFWFVERWTSRCWHIFTTNQSNSAASHVPRLFGIIRLFLSDLWSLGHRYCFKYNYDSQRKGPRSTGREYWMDSCYLVTMLYYGCYITWIIWSWMNIGGRFYL